MNYEEAIALGKGRSDCSKESIDALLQIVRDSSSVPGDIAEFGAYKCGATICMAATASEKTVFAFDVFGGYIFEGQEVFVNFANAEYPEIETAVAPFRNIKLVQGLFADTVPRFIAQTAAPVLSLIFLDADFYESHRIVLEHMWSFLSPCGSIVFHDWGLPDVQRAINEFSVHQSECDRWERLPDPASNMGIICRAR